MAVSVSILTILRAHTGGEEGAGDRATLGAVITDLETNHPGLAGRLRDENGALLRFVNIYVNDEDVRFTGGLDTEVGDGDDVTVLPAVAGGDKVGNRRRRRQVGTCRRRLSGGGAIRLALIESVGHPARRVAAAVAAVGDEDQPHVRLWLKLEGPNRPGRSGTSCAGDGRGS